MTYDASNRTGVLTIAVLAGFTAVTFVFFSHWSLHPGSLLIGPSEDNLQDYWNTWYGVTKASPGHFFFTNLIRYPTGTPLYYHSFDYPQIAAVALLHKIAGTAPLIVLQNITLLAVFPLAGAGAFFLTRHFTHDVLGATVGGFVFAFNPWHVEQAMHHAHVSSVEFIPMFVLAYLLALERKSVLWLSVAIVLYALNALSCWYYLIYIGFFLVFHFLYTAVSRPEGELSWWIGAPIVCAAGVLAILAPLVIPMMMAALHGAPVYTNPHDSKTFVADIAAYFAFPPTHLLASVGDPVTWRLTGYPWEAAVYLGLINLALLIWAFVQSGPDDRFTFIYLLAGMATFAVLASGDELHVVGNSLAAMPGALLSQLPLLANARTPARAIVFVYLFLCVGVGLATRLVFDRYGPTIARPGLYIVLLLIAGDFYPAHLDATPFGCKPGWARIRADASQGYGILMLPRGLKAPPGEPDMSRYEQVNYMFEQAACHERPIGQGSLSRDVVTGLLEALNSHDMSVQKEQLAGARVKYIVIDRTFPWDLHDGARSEYSLVYPMVYDGADMTILRVY